jgi:hypothetical protein
VQPQETYPLIEKVMAEDNANNPHLASSRRETFVAWEALTGWVSSACLSHLPLAARGPIAGAAGGRHILKHGHYRGISSFSFPELHMNMFASTCRADDHNFAGTPLLAILSVGPPPWADGGQVGQTIFLWYLGATANILSARQAPKDRGSLCQFLGQCIVPGAVVVFPFGGNHARAT